MLEKIIMKPMVKKIRIGALSAHLYIDMIALSLKCTYEYTHIYRAGSASGTGRKNN